MHSPVLADDEKRELYRNGYVVLRNVVAPDLLAAARAGAHMDTGHVARSDDRRIIALYNDTVLPAIMDEVMGPHTRPLAGLMSNTLPGMSDPMNGEQFDPKDVPDPHPRLDGQWTGECDTPYSEIVSAGHDPNTWGSDSDPLILSPDSEAPLWQDPERTLSIGSYTALVGVCMSDQTTEGHGQFAVQRGAHEAVQTIFRKQRAKGGPVGPGGPLWPRLVNTDDDRALAGRMPAAMTESYPKRTFDAKGWPWHELTPILMATGDAFIALHSLQKTPTPNMGSDPCINVCFRIRRARDDNPYEDDPRVGWGISTQPDRALNGDFLAYPDAYNPWQTSIDKLCRHWSEWDGMQRIIEAEHTDLAELHSEMADYW